LLLNMVIVGVSLLSSLSVVTISHLARVVKDGTF